MLLYSRGRGILIELIERLAHVTLVRRLGSGRRCISLWWALPRAI
jgi:hypothetical protein